MRVLGFFGGVLTGCAGVVALSQYVPSVELKQVSKEESKVPDMIIIANPDTGEVMKVPCKMRVCTGLVIGEGPENEPIDIITDEEIEIYKPLLDAIASGQDAGYDSYTTPDGEFYPN